MKKINNVEEEKEYMFDVTLNVGVSVSGKNEKEARGKLTEAVWEYFAETTLEVNGDEAKLESVTII